MARAHFDTGRTLVNTVGEAGSGPGQFSTPHAVVIDAHDRIFVADRENSRVQVFDVRGQFQHQITAQTTRARSNCPKRVSRNGASFTGHVATACANSAMVTSLPKPTLMWLSISDVWAR